MATETPFGGDAPSTARILQLVASGQARSRTELAHLLSAAPSTVSLRVQELLAAGAVTESGEGRSAGGRRPRMLSVDSGLGYVWMADLGSRHARIGLLDIGGTLLHSEEVPLLIAENPADTVAELARGVEEITARVEPRGTLLGIGLGIPGPVDTASGAVTLPSRMPGWRGYAIREAMLRRFGVPVVVDNDANLMALGESRARSRLAENLVVVKAGTGIGSGVVVRGGVYRGGTAVAGDISHVRVASGGETPCSCGTHGCLETVASGAALVEQLRDKGVDVSSTTDVVRGAEDGEPAVVTAVRSAGAQLGEVLATVVNFFNPDAVLLGGALSISEGFVAAVRASLYERCLPLATRNLEIARLATGPDAGLLGAGLLVLDTALAAQLSTLAGKETV